MNEADIKALLAHTLAEQQRPRYSGIDVGVHKTVAAILVPFGTEEEDPQELHADLRHLRRWRKNVELAQTFTLKAMVTVIATGFVGVVWLGVKVALGK